MVKGFGAGAVFAVVAVSIAGCSSTAKPQPGGGGGDNPAGDTAWASNASDLARFSDEVPFGPEAIVAKDKTAVRKAPGGDVIATLPSGVEVTKLAAHGSDDLICFDDPKGGSHMAGWVSQSSLEDATPPPAPAPTTPPPGPSAEDAGPMPPPPAKGHHHRKRRGGH